MIRESYDILCSRLALPSRSASAALRLCVSARNILNDSKVSRRDAELQTQRRKGAVDEDIWMLRDASLPFTQLERECCRQNAVPPPGIRMSIPRPIAVLEHVSKVCIALTAKDFRSFHSIGDVGTCDD